MLNVGRWQNTVWGSSYEKVQGIHDERSRLAEQACELSWTRMGSPTSAYILLEDTIDVPTPCPSQIRMFAFRK